MLETTAEPKAKPKYSKPIVVDLSELGSGTGTFAYCNNGSSASVSCSTGMTPAGLCTAGTGF
jgi:hypothetical protein